MNILHGTPDARVRGADVCLRRDKDDDDDGSSIDSHVDDFKKSSTAEIMEEVSNCSDDSEGTTTLFEAKIKATSLNDSDEDN